MDQGKMFELDRWAKWKRKFLQGRKSFQQEKTFQQPKVSQWEKSFCV